MEILCPKCRNKYQIPDALAGKRARCKNESCGQVFMIPAPAATAPAPAVLSPAQSAPLAGGHPAGSSLLDEFPSMPLDGLPQEDSSPAAAAGFLPSRSWSSHKKKWYNSMAFKVGGGIAAVLVVGGLLAVVVSTLVGGNAGSSAAEWSPYDYVPDNAQFVAYVNVDDLRNSDLYAEIRKLIEEQSPQGSNGFDFDNVSEAFLAGRGFGPNEDALLVLRTKEERSLKDFLPPKGRQQPVKSFQNIEYVSLGKPSGGKDGIVAKLGNRTFCAAPTEGVLKQTVERLARKERAPLAAGLQTAVDAVSGSRIYFAGVVPQNAGMPFTIDRFFGRVSISSSVEIELTAVFADATQAENCKKMIDGLIAMRTAMMPPNEKQMLDSLLNIRQSGNELSWQATLQSQQILDALKKAKEAGGGFPMAPGASPGRQGFPPGGFPPGPPGGFPGEPGR